MKSVLNWINRTMAYLGSTLQAPMLLVVRLFWGYFYVRSGVIKMGNVPNVAEYFLSYGIPCPTISACLTGFAHLLCGIAMVIGFMGRLTSIPLAFTMVVAYMTVHQKAALNIFENPAGFLQALPFLFLFANLLIIAFGPGKWSVDGWLARGEENPEY